MSGNSSLHSCAHPSTILEGQAENQLRKNLSIVESFLFYQSCKTRGSQDCPSGWAHQCLAPWCYADDHNESCERTRDHHNSLDHATSTRSISYLCHSRQKLWSPDEHHRLLPLSLFVPNLSKVVPLLLLQLKDCWILVRHFRPEILPQELAVQV